MFGLAMVSALAFSRYPPDRPDLRKDAYSVTQRSPLHFVALHTTHTMLAACIVLLLLVVLVATESNVSHDGQN
jgi:hypothetical protein